VRAPARLLQQQNRKMGIAPAAIYGIADCPSPLADQSSWVHGFGRLLTRLVSYRTGSTVAQGTCTAARGARVPSSLHSAARCTARTGGCQRVSQRVP
jgi:hypothetical protein